MFDVCLVKLVLWSCLCVTPNLTLPSSPSSVNAAVPPVATAATRNLANDWNLKSTFHGQGILDPVPAIRELHHKIWNPQRVIQKPRFSWMHLILEECQPVSRRVSFHKRRSSVRKSEKDAIGSHLIQAADNVPRKLKFHFLNFPYCIAKFHMSYRSSNSSQ